MCWALAGRLHGTPIHPIEPRVRTASITAPDGDPVSGSADGTAAVRRSARASRPILTGGDNHRGLRTAVPAGTRDLAYTLAARVRRPGRTRAHARGRRAVSPANAEPGPVVLSLNYDTNDRHVALSDASHDAPPLAGVEAGDR